MFVVLFACVWSLLCVPQCLSLEEPVASSAQTFCSLAVCRDLQQALVPVQSSIGVAENPGVWLTCSQSGFVLFKNNSTAGVFPEAFLQVSRGHFSDALGFSAFVRG